MSAVFVCGDLMLDGARFELRRGGERVDVQPKVLRLIFHLASNRDRSVSNAELLSVLWPNEKVSPASIKRAVRGARRALGDSPDSSAAIRTVRGYGYQFVLPIREAREGSVAPDDVFVGREGVLATLDALLAESCGGRGRCVLVCGEAGIGKTRLLHELLRRARAAGAQAWFARCMEVNGAPAFWPLIQLLRDANQSLGSDELRALMGPGAADLAQAIPELGAWLPELESAPRIDSVSARFRFFDSMTLFLKRASERRPIALVFDDLERADQPTLRYLKFLLRQFDNASILVAGSVRSLTQRAVPGLSLVGELAQEPCARCIDLLGLTPCELSDFLRAKLEAPLEAGAVLTLHELTAGNPLFVQQLLSNVRLPAEGEVLTSEWITSASQSGGLHGAIERHLDGLSAGCMDTLRAAAVLGRQFSVGPLTRLTEASSSLVLEHLAEAAASGLMRSLPDTLADHRFVHALIRDALYDRIPVSERALLHARAGLALEAAGASANEALLPKLAEHFALAAPAHDGGRALKYAELAAQAATERLAYEEAAAHLDRALALLELEGTDPQTRLRLLLAKGQALVRTREVAQARTTLLETIRLAHELSAVDVLVRAARALAEPPESGAVDAPLAAMLREALSALPDGDPRKPCLQALVAKSLSYSGDLEQCAELGLAALKRVRELDLSALRVDALEGCVEALAGPDYLAERVAIVDELTQLGHESSDYGILMRALTTRIWNTVELGDMQRVDAAIEQLEVLVQRTREPLFRWHVRVFRAMRAMVQGKLALAEQLSREALELGAPMHEAIAHHAYVLQVAGNWRLQGRLPEARAMVAEISAQYPHLGGWRATLAGLDAQLGQREQARAVFEALIDHDLAALRREPFLLSALVQATELCVQVGDAATAKTVYEATLPYEAHHGTVAWGIATHGPMARLLGMLAMRMGDFERADRHFQSAIAASEAMPSPLLASSSHLARAHALLLDGTASSRALMTESLRRACELADESELPALAIQCRRLAKKAGIELFGDGRRSAVTA